MSEFAAQLLADYPESRSLVEAGTITSTPDDFRNTLIGDFPEVLPRLRAAKVATMGPRREVASPGAPLFPGEEPGIQEPNATFLQRSGAELKNWVKGVARTQIEHPELGIGLAPVNALAKPVTDYLLNKPGVREQVMGRLAPEPVPTTGSFLKNVGADIVGAAPQLAELLVTGPAGEAVGGALAARKLIGPAMKAVVAGSVSFGAQSALDSMIQGRTLAETAKSTAEGIALGGPFAALPLAKSALKGVAEKITKDTAEGMAGLWRHPTFGAAVARVAAINPERTKWYTDVAATALALTAAEKAMHPELTNQEIAASVLPMTVFKAYGRAMQGWKARGLPVPTPEEGNALVRDVTDSILRAGEPVALPPEGLGELPSGTGQERAIAARFSPTIAEARRIAPELAGVEERLTAARGRLKEAQDQAADFASTSDSMEGLQPILEARDRAAAEVRTLENEHAGRAIEALERRIRIGEEHIAGLQERIGREQDETSRDVLEDDFARATDRIEALRAHLGEIRDAQARGDYGAGVIEKQAGDLRLEAGGTEGQQGREGTTKGAVGAKETTGTRQPPRPGVPGEQEAVAGELMQVQGRLAKEYPETNQETMWDLPRAARTEYEGLTGREAELKARMREILAAQAAARTQTGQGGEINAETIRGNAGLPGEAGNVAAGGPGAGGEVVQRAPEAGAGAGNAVGEVTGPKPLTAGQKRIAESFVRTLPEGAPAVAPGAAETILPAAEERLAGLRTAVDQAADKVRRRGNQLKRKNLKPERRVFYREEYAAAERELEAARKELGEAEKEAGGGNRTDQADRTNLEAGKPPTGSETQPAPGETRASAAGKRIAATPESAKGLERAVRDLVVQSGARVRVRISEEAPYLTTEEALRYPEGSDVRAAGERGRAAGKAATTTRKFASINLETGEVKIFKDGTLLDAVHEIAHWFREKPGIFTLRERTAIEAAFPGDWNGERFARAAEDWWKKQGGKEGTTEGAKGTKSLLERAYRKFVEFLKNVGDTLGLRDLTVGDVYGRMYRGEMKGRLEGQLRGGALVTGELHQAEEARRLRDLDEHFPVDTVAPELLDTKRGNAEILQSAADLMKSWPEKVTAADGAEILLHNPQGGLLSARVYHMLRDGRTGAIHKEKAAWLPNVPETLKNAAARLYDDENQTHIYVRAYEDGTKHFVVVAPDGQVSDQIIAKGRLITQFPRTATGKQWGMRVVWERGDATRQVPGRPGATPRASMILDSQRGEFQEGLSQGKGGEVKGKERLQAADREAAQEAKRTLNEIERFQAGPRRGKEETGAARTTEDTENTEKRKGKTGWIPKDSTLNAPEFAEVKKRMGQSFEIEKGTWMRRAHSQMRGFLRYFTSAFPHMAVSQKELRALGPEQAGFRNWQEERLRLQKEHRSRAQMFSTQWWKKTFTAATPEQKGAANEDAIAQNLKYNMEAAARRGVSAVQLPVERAETRVRNMEEALRTADPGDAARRAFLEKKIQEAKGTLADARQNLEEANRAGESLPWGLTQAQAAKWIADVEARSAKDPVVLRIRAARAELFQDLARQQVELGILTKSQAQNPYYYHEIMIEYADAYEVLMSTGERLKTPQGRSYQRHRSLNDKDYLTNVLKVDHLVVGQMKNDILDAELIRDISNHPYVVKINSEIRAEMARITEERQKTDPFARPATLLDVLKNRPELQNWEVNPGVRMFTRMGLREEAMKEITARLAAMPSDEFLLSTADLELKRQAGMYESFVMPGDVAKQLKDLHNESYLGTQGLVGKMVQPVMTLWKRAMLNLPWRSLRYGINNFIGDLEGVIAGCPSVVKGGEAWKKVFRDLYAYYKTGETTPELERAIKGGVLSGGQTIQELGRSFEDLPAYRRFMELVDRQEGKKLGMGDAARFARRLWGITWAGETMNEFRESLLRYKSFLYAEEQLAKGKEFGSAELPWAASLRERFEGLSASEQAAKWSRELLVDYGAISAGGQMLRRYLIPFYSWMEGNPRRYKRLIGNSIRELKDHWGDERWNAARPATRLAVSFLMMTGGVAMFNKLMFGGDEEAEKGMPEYAKERGYLLVTPPGEKHGVYYLRVASASRDLLEWAGGIEGNINVWRQFANGQVGIGEAILHVPKEAINKAVGSLGPISSGAQLAFGQTLFPDVFHPRPMKNRDVELANSLGLQGIYEWAKDFLTPVPARGGADPWLAMLALKHNDPGLGAYNEIRDLRYQFSEQVLNQTWEGGGGTPKSKLAYLLRVARRLGDEKAQDRIVERLGELGVRPGQVRELLKGADPLRGLSRANRRAFEDWLTPEQRDKLEMAETYYQETFR